MHRNYRPSGKLAGPGLTASYISKQYDGKIAGLYDLEETLGRGHFAVVKLARHVFTGEKVAVKVIDKSKLDDISKAHLFQEVRCMKLVQHPNVVRLYEVIDTATKLYLVLELGDGGDLYEYIMRHDTGLPEPQAREYFGQIVRAISYCHKLHVVHRDLKPENVVFFKKQGIVKLTDFGFSNKFYPGQKLETSCGSLAYSAPEILLGDSYDAPAVDVWSLGVILYMLVCGQPPFQEANDSETLTMIMDCKYDIPSHVSQDCRKLISRMLLRNPEHRATLAEIANHPWLNNGKQEQIDALPLVSKEQLSEEDHNLIVQKIVNGNIATKEEIQESLEKNEYNHITATYFLLAERKLRYKRQEQINRNKRPEELAVFKTTPVCKKENSTIIKPSLLSVPRTPGDIPQRTRKCSIVQEDEEEEDISTCSGIDNLGPPLNRRGSKSEGRLNLTLQERLAESEKRKPVEKKYLSNAKKSNSVFTHSDQKHHHQQQNIPIITTNIDQINLKQQTHYDTVPPLSATNTYVPVNEIFVDGESRQFPELIHRNRHHPPPYEQRKSKFHKNRTASCSSSDASDDDSEKRKKRAQKLTSTPSKTFEGRRDSHDDSSDSQEPGTGTAGGAAGCSGVSSSFGVTTINSNRGGSDPQDCKERNGNYNSNNNERKNANMNFARNHKVGRKKSGGKTRLRESQSLNRITEVQEDTSAQALVVSTTIFSIPGSLAPKVKSVGSKILQGLQGRTSRKSPDNKECLKYNEKLRMSRRDTLNNYKSYEKPDTCNKIEKFGVRKMRMFGKYFHVHKKFCIPLTGLFNRSSNNNNNGLYKAQSCGSLTKDKIFTNSALIHHHHHHGGRHRAVSVIRHSDSAAAAAAGGGDINQNEPTSKSSSSMRDDSSCPPTTTSNFLDLNSVCTEICAVHVHIGHASKCCSFC